MITRLHIENYRSIDNLTLELGQKNLLMGANGSGKSSILDALAGIRDIVSEGQLCSEASPGAVCMPGSVACPW